MLTGADEHGQKIANTAAGQGIAPQELVDTCVARFKALDERLDVAYDDYLRTTSERHKACCRELWRRCASKGDVFLERYDGVVWEANEGTTVYIRFNNDTLNWLTSYEFNDDEIDGQYECHKY